MMVHVLCAMALSVLLPGRIKNAALNFVSLQSPEASSLEKDFGKTLPDSVIYSKNGKLYFESAAVIHVLSDLGGIWFLMRALLIIPRFLRDGVYRFISRRRHKILRKH